MKVTIKTLQQTNFTLEIEPSDTVLSVKQKISEKDPKASIVEKQKLIHSGRILVNEKSVEESGIKEGDFLVLMVSSTISATKPKVEGVSATNAGTTGATTSSTGNSTPSTTTSTPAAATTHTTTSTPATSAFEVNEEAVNSISEMGFPRDEVIRALRASFNNADRAVEYLTNGIPEGIINDGDDDSVAEASASIPASNTGASNTTDNIESNPLAFLLQSPQFIQLRLVVQQNPRLLAPLLEQIAQSNPEIFELIKDNQEDFMALIQRPLSETELSQLAADVGEEGGDEEGMTGDEQEDGGDVDPTSVIQVSEEEQSAIERLMALGFDRPRVIEAYFACDKNETIAANFLFEHMNDDDF